MKYLIFKTQPDETVPVNYLIRNLGAKVVKKKTVWKTYCPESKTLDYFGNSTNFKSFCTHSLSYNTKGNKPEHSFSKQDVEFVSLVKPKSQITYLKKANATEFMKRKKLSAILVKRNAK